MGKVIALPWFDYEVIDSGDKKKLGTIWESYSH
jgi:hypothetical protein